MASLRVRYLSPDEIEKIVSPLLTASFAPFGYRDSSVKEDEAFDGEPIIRVKADVERPVPAEQLVSTLGRIHDALRAEHEERFVFLSAPGPSLVAPAGGEDEED